MTTARGFKSTALLFAKLLAVVVIAGASLASAQTESVIHAFQSSSKHDGVGPYGVVADSNGALYGVTYGGGKYGQGTVYKLSPPAIQGGTWKQSLLYTFTGGADGGGPSGTLFLNPRNNKIYGTTVRGGGAGLVFELTPGKTWTETVIHTFAGGRDGVYPNGGLISDGHGTLYGTTSAGGSDQYGVVFRLSPPAQPGGAWNEAVLYAFQGGGTDALAPSSGLLMDASGALYGTTPVGGANGLGAVYKVTPPAGGRGSWTESVLYSFAGYTDGIEPLANPIFDGKGALYGTTEFGGVAAGVCGCGTVFQLTPPAGGSGPWTETTLYAFNGTADGASPNAGLIFDSAGALYGTASLGGDDTVVCFSGQNRGCGTAFKLSPPSTQGGAWTQSVLHTFENGGDGGYPIAPLLQVGTTFYGTTYLGGTPNVGTVFEITP